MALRVFNPSMTVKVAWKLAASALACLGSAGWVMSWNRSEKLVLACSSLLASRSTSYPMTPWAGLMK